MFRTSKLIALLTAIVVATSYYLYAQEDLPASGEQPAAADQQAAAPAAEGANVPVYSYAIGLEIGNNFKSDDVKLDFDSLLSGIKDAMSGAEPKYDQATCLKALQQLGQAKVGAAVAQNKEFLEKNKKAEGVTTLPSGLQYKVLKSGDGPTPTAADTVRTHYKGTLIDGTVFDSSYDRGEPAEFPVGGVIKGWTEALQKMKVGDKWELVIPSELAYGEAGAGGVIPPGATLIFEIELLDVKKQ
jgi:FKBP-type peptidyl-prolyl cis-trans isomerase FklB